MTVPRAAVPARDLLNLYDISTMCSRYNLINTSRLQYRFDTVNDIDDLPPRYNIAPSQQVLIVTNRREMEMVRWGLVPRWAKDAKFGNRTINARAETIAEKPSFRQAFRSRRCLIPATGFYEWRATPEGKVPYHIRLKSGAVFGMAGLYETWTDADGREMRSCTIITTTANDVLAPIHQRMPVIIPPEDEAAWLDLEETEPEALQHFLVPYPAEEMEAYPISTLVNKPGIEDAGVIEPADPE